VFHFGRRIAFGMNIADFLELQRALEGDRIKILPTQIKDVIHPKIAFRHFLDGLVATQVWRMKSGMARSSRIMFVPCRLDRCRIRPKYSASMARTVTAS